jgi:hypothetical protein
METRSPKNLALFPLRSNVVRRRGDALQHGVFLVEATPHHQRTCPGAGRYHPRCHHQHLRFFRPGCKKHLSDQQYPRQKNMYIRLPGMVKLSAGCFYDYTWNHAAQVFANSKIMAGSSIHRHWRWLISGQPAILPSPVEKIKRHTLTPHLNADHYSR